jgi:hypothetical protein
MQGTNGKLISLRHRVERPFTVSLCDEIARFAGFGAAYVKIVSVAAAVFI